MLSEVPCAINGKKISEYDDPKKHVAPSTDLLAAQSVTHAQLLQVFATDHILACLMAATRSIYSWDIIVTKLEGTNIYFVR